MKFQGHTEHRTFPTSKLEVSTKRKTLNKFKQGNHRPSEMGKVCLFFHGMPWIDDEDFTLVFVFSNSSLTYAHANTKARAKWMIA